MVYSVKGELLVKKEGFAVVSVGGLGLKIYAPLPVMASLPDVGMKVELFCHLHVREDALDLFGFSTEAELKLFESLISVNGVGPKTAINIMGVAKGDQLIAAINEGKTDLLVRASGIGKKTAERVVLDLKGKLSFVDNTQTLGLMESDLDLEETLVSLGYSKAQAKAAIAKIDPAVKGFNERLKAALRTTKK
jgi:Holliday junction DNA helicase RuvA